jgi:uncharacterized protein (TIGR02757 family)
VLLRKLEKLYTKFNRREFVVPDPLQFVWLYDDPADQEVAGLIASSLAFGSVAHILSSVEWVLQRMPKPALWVRGTRAATMRAVFQGFRHRYVDADDLVDLLCGTQRALERRSSLRACFAEGLKADDATMLPGLSGWVAALREGSQRPKNYLLPSPTLGSACKRLNLFLRWMVRKDDVDPGVWAPLPLSKLVVPLDTHMHRIGLRMGFTSRKQGNLRTALEITEGFRRLCPEDPVRYDFVLTHLSMRKNTELQHLLGD